MHSTFRSSRRDRASRRKHPVATSSASRTSLRELLSPRTLLQIVVVWAAVLIFEGFLGDWLHTAPATLATAAFVLLFAVILFASFGVVRQADHLAKTLGEPYGTLILTLSVVLIEVFLIAAVMLGPSDAPTIGRDSIFAVMMIIMNLVMGVALLVGGLRHGQQEYNRQGSAAYLAMIALLVATAFFLPNALSGGALPGAFARYPALLIAVLTVVLYGAFLALQMTSSRQLFVQPPAGHMSAGVASSSTAAVFVPSSPSAVTPPLAVAPRIQPADHAVHQTQPEGADTPPVDPLAARDVRALWVRASLLVALLLGIVMLSHHLATLIERGVEGLGAPVALGGLLIAVIVFTPESLTALRAAGANQMQRVLNLCLGAFVSTVGLTVPTLLAIGLMSGKTVVLGLGPVDAVLAVATIALTAFTFMGQRTTALHGVMHLMLFAAYAGLLFA